MTPARDVDRYLEWTAIRLVEEVEDGRAVYSLSHFGRESDEPKVVLVPVSDYGAWIPLAEQEPEVSFDNRPVVLGYVPKGDQRFRVNVYVIYEDGWWMARGGSQNYRPAYDRAHGYPTITHWKRIDRPED